MWAFLVLAPACCFLAEAATAKRAIATRAILMVETLKPLVCVFLSVKLSGTPISQEIESYGCSLSVDATKPIYEWLIGKE